MLAKWTVISIALSPVSPIFSMHARIDRGDWPHALKRSGRLGTRLIDSDLLNKTSHMSLKVLSQGKGFNFFTIAGSLCRPYLCMGCVGALVGQFEVGDKSIECFVKLNFSGVGNLVCSFRGCFRAFAILCLNFKLSQYLMIL